MISLKKKINFEYSKDLYKKRIKERKRIKGLFFSYPKDHKKNLETSEKFIDNENSAQYIITEKNISQLMTNYNKLKRDIFAREQKEKEIEQINEKSKNFAELTYTKLNDIFSQFMRNKNRNSSIGRSINKKKIGIDNANRNSDKNRVKSALQKVSLHFNKAKTKIDFGQYNNNGQSNNEKTINHILNLIKKSNKKLGIKSNNISFKNGNNYNEKNNQNNNVVNSTKSNSNKNVQKRSFLFNQSNKSNNNSEINCYNLNDNDKNTKQNNVYKKKRKNFISYTCKNLNFKNLTNLNNNEMKLRVMTLNNKKDSNSKKNLQKMQNYKRLGSFKKNSAENKKRLLSLFDIVTTENTNTNTLSDLFLDSNFFNSTKTNVSYIKKKSNPKIQNQTFFEKKHKNILNLKKKNNEQKKIQSGSYKVTSNKVRFQPFYTANIRDFVDNFNRIKKVNHVTEIKCKENHFLSYKDISKIMKVKEDLMMHLLKEKYFISQFPKLYNEKLNHKEIFVKKLKDSFDNYDNLYSTGFKINALDLDE